MGAEGMMDAQLTFNAVLSALRLWLERHHREGEQWQRVIEVLKARVNEEGRARRGKQCSEAEYVEVVSGTAKYEGYKEGHTQGDHMGEMDESLDYKMRRVEQPVYRLRRGRNRLET